MLAFPKFHISQVMRLNPNSYFLNCRNMGRSGLARILENQVNGLNWGEGSPDPIICHLTHLLVFVYKRVVIKYLPP